MTIVNYLPDLAMGAAVSAYVPIIAASSRIMGSPTMGNVPFLCVPFVASLPIAAATGQRG